MEGSLFLHRPSDTKGKEKLRQAVDVRLSADVGSYVCGFNYFTVYSRCRIGLADETLCSSMCRHWRPKKRSVQVSE